MGLLCQQILGQGLLQTQGVNEPFLACKARDVLQLEISLFPNCLPDWKRVESVLGFILSLSLIRTHHCFSHHFSPIVPSTNI